MGCARRFAASGLIVILLIALAPSHSAQPAPRLILFIVVDQMRADYLERFRDQFTGGLKLLLEKGAVFANAHYHQLPTVTASGHATLITGRNARSTGIVGNAWYDRVLRKTIQSIEDAHHKQQSGSGSASPENLNGHTLGDVLKAKHPNSRVVSISIKDRSAILLGGKHADQVYWYDADNGLFTSSSYYLRQFPDWVERFNNNRPAAAYFGRRWEKLLDGQEAYRRSGEDSFAHEADGKQTSFPHAIAASSRPDAAFYRALTATPFSDELTLAFAREALLALALGRDGSPDLMAISLSATDSIGHLYGPFSHEIHDQMLRLDRMLGDFLSFVEKQVGLGNCIVALSSDHGVMPLPEWLAKRGLEAGRINVKQVEARIRAALRTRAGSENLIARFDGPTLYFDPQELSRSRLSLPELVQVAIDVIKAEKGIAEVYSRIDLLSGEPPGSRYGRLAANGFHAERSPDLLIVPKENYIFSNGTTGTTHGSPHPYDTHVPMIIFGPTATAGSYSALVSTEDLAPTLASILGLELTAATGRARREILARGTGH